MSLFLVRIFINKVKNSLIKKLEKHLLEAHHQIFDKATNLTFLPNFYWKTGAVFMFQRVGRLRFFIITWLWMIEVLLSLRAKHVYLPWGWVINFVNISLFHAKIYRSRWQNTATLRRRGILRVAPSSLLSGLRIVVTVALSDLGLSETEQEWAD